MAKHMIGTVEEIPPGEHKILEVAGRSIGVYNVGGEFYAIRNTCPHQGGPLCEGRVTGFVTASVPGDYTYTREGEIVRCPWHGWEFDIKTGQSWFDPVQTRVRAYPVTVENVTVEKVARATQHDEAGMEKGPYMAETYDVTLEQHAEQQLIVVEIP